MTSIRDKSELSPSIPIQHKVFGKPIQDLYTNILNLPKAPHPPAIIGELCRSMEKFGLHYHPRTIKRQLKGNIEYVPEALELALIHWVQDQKLPGSKKSLNNFEKAKKDIENSDDLSLYISPDFFIQMAEGFLFLHKQLSRRKLALLLQIQLEKRKVFIGLETLQAALAGKTQKIRKVIEEELKQLFFEDGFNDKKSLDEYLKKVSSEGKNEIKKVEVENIVEAVDAYLLKTKDISKRQFAIKVKACLEIKGYVYHLSSIQSVIEGKTRKTKKAILETIYEIFADAGISKEEGLQKALLSIPESQRGWNHYINAEIIPSLVEQIIEQNPSMTRRKLALLMRDDLSENNFNFSLNTLQYILGGKTKRTRKIVLDLIEGYLKDNRLAEAWAAKAPQLSSPKGRPSITHRLLEAYDQLAHASPQDRPDLERKFYLTREEMIKRRWTTKFQQTRSPYRGRRRNKSNYWDEMEAGESSQDLAENGNEPSVAYDVESKFDRLVS